MDENLKILYYCKGCKNHKEVMKNKKVCFECYNNQLKYCDLCRRSYIGYENHMKLHKARNAEEQTGSLITDIANALVAPVSQYCKYCKKNYR